MPDYSSYPQPQLFLPGHPLDGRLALQRGRFAAALFSVNHRVDAETAHHAAAFARGVRAQALWQVVGDAGVNAPVFHAQHVDHVISFHLDIHGEAKVEVGCGLPATDAPVFQRLFVQQDEDIRRGNAEFAEAFNNSTVKVALGFE